MADVKESAMTQKSDCKWVRALDANGNSIRISKEDLAQVVGGLLDYPFKYVTPTILIPDKNLQNINRAGFCRLADAQTYSNIPDGMTNNGVNVISTVYNGNGAVILITSVFSVMYFISVNEGSWATWVKVG